MNRDESRAAALRQLIDSPAVQAVLNERATTIRERAATVPRVPRARGSLTDEQEQRLRLAAERRAEAEATYRAECVAALAEGASFAEVAAFTGLSTNTLQRWKRESKA